MLAAAEAAAPKWRRPTQRRRPRQGPTADVHPVAMAGGGGRTGKGTGNGSLPPPLMLVAVASGSRGAAVAAVGVAAGHRGAANRGGRPARRRRHGRAAAAAVVDGGSWGGGGGGVLGRPRGGPWRRTLVARPGRWWRSRRWRQSTPGDPLTDPKRPSPQGEVSYPTRSVYRQRVAAGTVAAGRLRDQVKRESCGKAAALSAIGTRVTLSSAAACPPFDTPFSRKGCPTLTA